MSVYRYLRAREAVDSRRQLAVRGNETIRCTVGDLNGTVRVGESDLICVTRPDGRVALASDPGRHTFVAGQPVLCKYMSDGAGMVQLKVVARHPLPANTVLFTYEDVGGVATVLQITPAGVVTNLGTRTHAATSATIQAYGGWLLFPNIIASQTGNFISFYSAATGWITPSLPARYAGGDNVGAVFFNGSAHLLFRDTAGTGWNLYNYADPNNPTLISTLSGIPTATSSIRQIHSPSPTSPYLIVSSLDSGTFEYTLRRWDGATWTALTPPYSPLTAPVLWRDNDLLYMYSAAGNPTYSTSDGITWTLVTSTAYSAATGVAFAPDGAIYLASGHFFFFPVPQPGGGIVHYGSATSFRASRLQQVVGSSINILVSTDGEFEIGGVAHIDGTIYFAMDDDTSSGTGSPPNGVHIWTGSGFTTLYAAAGPTHVLAKGEAVV